MKVRGVINNISTITRKYLFLWVLFSGVLFSQDPPSEFDFNISIYQSFYFFINSDIDGEPLVENEDWIAAFNEYDETMGGLCQNIGDDIDDNEFTLDCQDVDGDGLLSSSVDVCVGSFDWSGEYTTVPVMGDDATQWTVGYMQQDQLPKFKIYDGSEDAIYDAVPSVVYPWSTDLAFYVVNITVIRDCNGDLGGEAFVDDCGECVSGQTGLEENYLDIGCGCSEPLVGPFYEDVDGDGLGYGEEQYFCSNPGTGWSQNSNDPYPDCSYNYYDCNNDCGGTASLDDCDVCSGGDTGLSPNSDVDCYGECFGFAYYDECDQCVGGSTGLGPCDFESDQPEEFEFFQSTLQGFYYIVDGSLNNGDYIANQDWIAVFKGDVCVGSIKWDGAFTTLPAMGDDGSEWTEGYLNTGDFPTFKMYDASLEEFYDVEIDAILELSGSEEIPYTGWGINDFYYVYGFTALTPDCYGIVGGDAIIDDCGICSGGSTGLIPNDDVDCVGICFGDAQIDNCGVCAGGTSGNIANSDDLGCGCFLDAPGEYYADVDSDGFGFGETQSFCEDPGEGWSTTSNDPEPFCYNDDIYTLNVDDCGICNGGNENLDCAGLCFGSSQLDDCGICNGDNSSCQSPTVENINLSTDEDEAFTIQLSGSDPGNAELTYVINQAPEFGILVGDPDDLSIYNYTPNQNYNGQDSFTFVAFNGQFYSDEGTVFIQINSVNDAPTVESFLSDVEEDSSLEIILSGDDVEGDSLIYSIVSFPTNGSLTQESENIFIYNPNPDFYGEEQIAYTANDGELDSEQGIITIVINPINDPPIVEDFGITLYEDNLFNFTFDVIDVDNDDEDLSIYIQDDFDFGILTLSGLDATLLPNDNIFGEFVLSYKALDGSLFSEAANITISILPVNDPPILSNILGQSINEDETLYYQLDASDVDNDVLSYSVESLEHAEVTITNQTLTVSPELNFNGSLLVEVSVSDGEFSDTVSFNLDILPINDPPVLSDIEDQTSMEDDIFTLEIIAEDVDGDELTYWANSDDNVEVALSGNQLSVLPNQDWFGEVTISVNTTDGEFSDSEEFTLDILPVNDPPLLSDIDSQSIDEDDTFIYELVGYDVDGDLLEYSIDALDNAESSIDGNILSIIPSQNYNGEFAVNVSVSDNEFVDSKEFILDVLPINDPPTLELISNQVIDENEILELEFVSYDVDNDPLTYDYYISSGYGYANIDGELLIVTPAENWSGQLNISFTVSDGEYFVQQEFLVDVLEVDDPPIAFDISSILSEDESLSIELLSSDPDTDAEDLSYSIITSPSNGSAEIDGGSLVYTPASNYNGTDQITYSVSDAESESEAATIDINIVPVNDVPTAQDVEYTLSSGTIEFDLNTIVSDIDGDELEISFITQNYGSETISTLFEGEITDLGDNNFSYSPPSGMVFFDFILYKATDDVSESTVQTITFNLLGREMPRNMAPIAFDQDVSVVEDEIAAVTLIGFDVLNSISDNASFEITSYPEHGQLSSDFTSLASGSNSLVQWSIDYTPDNNYFGQDSFTYRVTNPDNNIPVSEDGTIYITISPSNDAPEVYLSVPNQTLLEDSDGSSLSLDLFFTDVDGDDISFDVVSTNDEDATISIEDGNLLIVPELNQYSAPFSVSIIATDGELEASQSFFVEILPVNDAPNAYSASEAVDEDNSVAIILNADDLEFDPLTYLIYQDPANGEIEIENNIATYTPTQDFNGIDSFGFRANDGEYNSELATIDIVINPVNDAPILDEVDTQYINEDSSFEFNISATDIDGDELAFLVTPIDLQSNEEISYELVDNALVINPPQDMNGDIEVEIEAEDPDGLKDVKSFILNVIPQPDAPVLVEVEDQLINEDQNLVIFLSATDVDGDELSYSGESNIEESLLSVENDLLIVTPPQDFYGDMIITAGVSDGLFNVQDDFTVTFTPQPDPPTIDLIPDQEALEAQELILSVTANDPDGDDLELAVDVDSQINVTINGFEIIFQSQNNVSGEFEVIVTVSDGELTDQAAFVLSVINVNDPPTAYSQTVTLNEDDSSMIILSADDPDLDPLQFFIDTYPQSGSVTSENGIVNYTPNSNFNGQDSFSFYASDGEEVSNISMVYLDVIPVNDGPVITSQPILTATEDILYSYQVIAEDPENDTLVYELIEFPSGMDINEDGLITWTPIEGQLSSGEIILMVSDNGEDGALPFTQTFIVTVEPVNDRPEIISTAPEFAYEDQEYTYQVQVSDPDSDTFYYNLLIGPDGLNLSSSGLITWTPENGVTSSGTVALVVWDVEIPNPQIDIPAVQEFVITVIPVNDPPSIVSSPNSNATEDIEYLYQVEVEDIDDDVFYFSLLEGPEDMEINQTTGLLSWTPTEGILSSGNISIRVEDSLNDDVLYDIQNYSISVTPVNDSPIIVSTAPTSGMQGQEYIYEILVEDPDDTDFVYLLFDAPVGMSIDFETGILSWIPTNGGVYGPITLRVQDGGEDFASPSSETFYINVQYSSGPTTLVIPLHSEYNLISYSAIPENNSIENVLSDLGDNITSIITEGLASVQLSDGWYGSLSTIEPEDGYWLRAPDEEEIGNDTLYHVIENALPTSSDYEYLIHPDYNLISYLGVDGVSVTDALPDDFEQHVVSIVGEGIAAIKLSDGWYGNLDAFYRNKGYWVRNELEEDSLYFSWVIPEEELLFTDGMIKKEEEIKTLNGFSYRQSSKQAFYFIDKINLDDISLTSDDWVIAYNDNVVVGARKWNGRYTDIPAMGDDGFSTTLGYCKNGDIPTFKLYIDQTGELIDLNPSNIEPWSDLSTTIIGQLNQATPIPDSFEFSYPYPNPFNPSTLIKFAIPNDTKVKIMAYDISGRHVDTVLNKRLNAGYYDLTWKPSNLSSGIYLINIQTNESDLTHKVMYIK